MKAILLILVACSMSLFIYGQTGKLKKANQYFNALSYSYAAELYEELIGSEIDSPELKSKLAYSYLKMNQTKEALKYYSELVDEEKATPKDYYNYSYALKKKGIMKRVICG